MNHAERNDYLASLSDDDRNKLLGEMEKKLPVNRVRIRIRVSLWVKWRRSYQ